MSYTYEYYMISELGSDTTLSKIITILIVHTYGWRMWKKRKVTYVAQSYNLKWFHFACPSTKCWNNLNKKITFVYGSSLWDIWDIFCNFTYIYNYLK